MSVAAAVTVLPRLSYTVTVPVKSAMVTDLT